MTPQSNGSTEAHASGVLSIPQLLWHRTPSVNLRAVALLAARTTRRLVAFGLTTLVFRLLSPYLLLILQPAQFVLFCHPQICPGNDYTPKHQDDQGKTACKVKIH